LGRKLKSDTLRGKGKADHSAQFFSHSDQKSNLAREKLAEESLEALIDWLKKEGNVGIMGMSTY
jgi:6-phosphofructo-2-kinase/fructose-2,6-biphosphatase 2